MPSIGSRDVACAEGPNIRRFENFLQLLDVVDNAFNVHSISISNISTATVKRRSIHNVVTVKCAARSRTLTLLNVFYRTETQCRPNLVNGDLRDGTPARALHRCPYRLATKITLDTRCLLRVGNPDQGTGVSLPFKVLVI
jgi:hypothetical protein